MVKQKLHNDIRRVIRSFDSLEPTNYTLNGLHRDIEKIQIMDPSNTLDASDDTAMPIRQKYLNVLITDIYNNLYNADASTQAANLLYKHDDFIADLSGANHGTGTWEDGWGFIGQAKNSEKLIVQKNEMKFWVEPERVRLLSETSCMVKIEKETRHLNSYFYYAYGDTDKTQIAGYTGQNVRFYWNIYPSVAPAYIDAVTSLLNKANILFTTKVLSDPEKYTRSDAAVLYVDSSQLNEVLMLIPYIYDRVREDIKEAVPLFVKKILPGLGFAEDPSNGLSFGISRSKLIAETVYECLQKNILDKNQMEEELSVTFQNAGISAANPYALTGNVEKYESLINKYTKLWKVQQQ